MAMAVPRSSLRGFLTHAKSALRAAIESSQKITLVIGNESADLDSMTSSVLYAYVRSLSPSRNAFTPLYVPITNIPTSDIALRPEYLAVFKHANIEPRHLITLDDLPDLSVIESKLHPENTKWILVDHNALQGRLGEIYSDRVGGVIDHHDEEGKVPKDTGSEPRIVEKSGSCTSLVTEYCRQAWDSLSESVTPSGDAQGGELSNEGANFMLWDAEVAQLGLASVLIDTANLQSEDKTTQHDRRAAEYLESKISCCPKFSGEFDATEFYKEIDSAKKDIGSLKLHDILRKDYKLWEENGQKLGISSVVKHIDFLQQKARSETDAQSDLDDSFIEALRQFCKERDLHLYSLMTTSTSAKGEFQRELLVWGFNDKASTAAKQFATNSREELGLVDWHESESKPNGSGSQDNGEWRKVFWQTQVQHSRKRVAPLLREAMT